MRSARKCWIVNSVIAAFMFGSMTSCTILWILIKRYMIIGYLTRKGGKGGGETYFINLPSLLRWSNPSPASRKLSAVQRDEPLVDSS